MAKAERDVVILGLSFILQALGIEAVALLGSGLEIKAPIASILFRTIVSIAVLIPISLNRIGIREKAFVYLLGLKGIPAAPALCLGLLFFAVLTTIRLLGGAAYVTGFHRACIMFE